MPQFDFARPFQYMFEDPNWVKKVLMGALFFFLGNLTFFLLGVGMWPLVGYMVRTARAVAAGEDHGLPEWNVGEDFGTGARVMLIAFTWIFVPMIVLGAVFAILIVGLAAVSSGGSGRGGADELIPVIALGGECIGFGIIGFTSLCASFGMLKFIDTDEVRDGFRIGGFIDLVKNNFVPLLLMMVVGFITNFIGGIGIILLCVGMFFTRPLAMLMAAHAVGQVIKIDRARKNAPVPNPGAPNVARAY